MGQPRITVHTSPNVFRVWVVIMAKTYSKSVQGLLLGFSVLSRRIAAMQEQVYTDLQNSTRALPLASRLEVYQTGVAAQVNTKEVLPELVREVKRRTI